jgi:hypothetical protein
MRLDALLAFTMAAASVVNGQWIHYQVRGIPRTRDGKPNLSARAPRMSSGTPDLSGTWQAESDPDESPQGTQGEALPKYFLDITRDLAREDVPFTPWAEALYKQRVADFLKDDPITRCLPFGVPRQDASADPFKTVQTRSLLIVLQEGDSSFRQIFLDGRPLPKDPQPSWMGYSVGRWEKDVLVVESRGFRDQGWLDAFGHPNSDALRVVERFHRRDFGHMDIGVTVDDPKAYRRPLTYTQSLSLIPDTELIESPCNENERDFRHLVGKK